VLSRISVVLSLAALGAALLIATPLTAAQTIPVPTQDTQGISVVGSGIVLAPPNIARITLGVEVFDPSLANAQADASRRMDAVIASLKAAGIQDADIRTVAFSINPQYDSRDQTQAVLRGYQVQNLVEARTSNAAGVGALVDSAVAAGATRVVGIQFESDNTENLKNQARDQAMQNARAKAEQLARDAGVSLGRPIRIEESDVGGVNPLRADVAPAALAAHAPSTPVQPGELRVQTMVRVLWAIQ
jgi:uncharacterized protein YggE